MNEFKDVAVTVGKSMAKAGAFVGRKVADGYSAIDPDVIRHLVQIPLLSYSLFVKRQEEIKDCEPDGYPPLIFVHGLGGSRGDFLLMSWFLWMHGRKRSYKIHFDSGQTTEEKAAALATFIKQVKKATGEQQVDIVAHSLGGLISRLAINEHELESSIRVMITLGTPHAGTYPARYANTDVTQDLRPDSDLIKKINSKPWPESIKGITLYSDNDLFVLPAESAKVDGTIQINMSPFTHYSYLVDPRSWNKVADFLIFDPDRVVQTVNAGN